jgi:hypothetical protein
VPADGIVTNHFTSLETFKAGQPGERDLFASKEVNYVEANSLSLLLNRRGKDSANAGTGFSPPVNVFPAPTGLARPWFTYDEQSH